MNIYTIRQGGSGFKFRLRNAEVNLKAISDFNSISIFIPKKWSIYDKADAEDFLYEKTKIKNIIWVKRFQQ